MTDENDPKDELGARFEDRANLERTASKSSDSDNMSESSDSDNASNTSSTSSASKPGPDKDPDASRNRERVYMAIGSDRAEDLNAMFDRFDARSKLADEGGLEKHGDFWMAAADFLIDHEDELADRLGVPDIDSLE